MKQDMILILDLGSEENPKIAREIRALGVYTEIHRYYRRGAGKAARRKGDYLKRRREPRGGWRGN